MNSFKDRHDGGETLVIRYETGHMELNLHEFFPCNSKELKKILGLIWDDETFNELIDYLKNEIKTAERLKKIYSDAKFAHFDLRMSAERALECNRNMSPDMKLKYQYDAYINSAGEKICTKFLNYLTLYKDKLQKNLTVVEEKYGNL